MALTQGTRLDLRRQPAQVSMKRVKFSVGDDSDSDDATVRAGPSQHHVQQNLPTRSELSRPPQIGNRKGELLYLLWTALVRLSL